MNREDIIRMAQEVGIPAANYPSLVSDKDWEALERFYQAAYDAGQNERRHTSIAMNKVERKPWVGLDHDDIHALVNEFFYRGMQPSGTHFANFGRAIEDRLKEKNSG